jgi:hypothetical protein
LPLLTIPLHKVSAQAIILVTAKAFLLDLTTEIMIGCGDEAYVYLYTSFPYSLGICCKKNILATFHRSDELAGATMSCMVSEFLQLIPRAQLIGIITRIARTIGT